MTHPSNPADITARAQRIAAQNDQFRQNLGLVLPGEPAVCGQVLMTPGITALPLGMQRYILEQVRSFGPFSAENDPYGEHDFGAFDVDGIGQVFFKIDYYDVDYHYGSEDPSNLAQTRRVLTIMLAAEY